MRVLILFLLAVTYIPALGCEKPESKSDSASVDLESLTKLAISGDSESALALFIYHTSDCRNDIADAMFWLRVAAEQGNCDGMLELARFTKGLSFGPSVSQHWASKAKASACPAHSRWDPGA